VKWAKRAKGWVGGITVGPDLGKSLFPFSFSIPDFNLLFKFKFGFADA
jgi:hypothetical protein